MMQPARAFSTTLVLTAALASASVAQGTRAQELRGSRESVELMYTRAIAVGLDFLKTPDEVYNAAVSGKLKLVSFTEDVALDEMRYPFVLPPTLDFITQLAEQYHAQCGERLVVTSGARPVDRQPRNAVRESVHPTGMAVDFHRPAEPCLTWLRKALVQLEDRGVIEATEERRPPHFHVAVLQRASTKYAVNIDVKGLPRRAPVESTSSEVASADSANCPKDSATTTVAARVDTATTKIDSGKTTVATRPAKANAIRASTTADEKKAKSADVKKATARASAYRVKAGDNLSTIAVRHHTTVKRLQELNHLRTSQVRAGQQLRLP
jgi:LysM repeat protein